MIFDISDSTFKNVLNDEQLFLPIRWDGVNFSESLEKLFSHYIRQLELLPDEGRVYGTKCQVDVKAIKRITGLLIRATSHYLNGFPAKAFEVFNKAMSILSATPLRIYQKSVLEQFDDPQSRGHNELKLFRAVQVGDNKPYQRNRVFHTPYNLRSKVSTADTALLDIQVYT